MSADGPAANPMVAKIRAMEFSPFVVSCERCKTPANSAGGRYRCQKCGRLVCDGCSDIYVNDASKVAAFRTISKSVADNGIMAHELLCRDCGAEAVLADGKAKVDRDA